MFRRTSVGMIRSKYLAVFVAVFWNSRGEKVVSEDLKLWLRAASACHVRISLESFYVF